MFVHLGTTRGLEGCQVSPAQILGSMAWKSSGCTYCPHPPGSGGKDELRPFNIQASLNPGALRAGSWASPLPSLSCWVFVSQPPPPRPTITSASGFCTDDVTHVFVWGLSLFPASQASSLMISLAPFPGCPLPLLIPHWLQHLPKPASAPSQECHFLGPLGEHWGFTLPHQLPHTYSGGR